jgi:uncharacterized protein (DUF885 family)
MAPTAVFALSERHVDRMAELDPIDATFMGVEGHDHLLTDYSPDGHQARAEAARSTLAELAATVDEGAHDRLARRYHVERLGLQLELHEAATWASDLNIIACPLQSIRDVFDVTKDPGEREARLRAVPEALAGWRTSLEEGVTRGQPAARHQALRCATQADRRAEWFSGLGDRHPEGAAQAARAFTDTASWLRDWYAPRAAAADGVGRDRYRLHARAFLGTDVDPITTYEWGWDEVGRIATEMRRIASGILPGADLAEVFHHLEHDSDYAVHGIDALQRWAQGYVEEMIDRFGAHFDIADPIRRCTVNIAPAGGPSAAYYMPPNEDWSRAGAVWYPDLGADRRYPLWSQVTTANHEAVPGHHLQCAQVLYRADRLSRFQRLSFVSGHGEGWALYAERLCQELGLLDRPETVLGFLSAQQLRAVRVVVDIGLHLGLAIPDDSDFHPGETWDRNLAVAFAVARTGEPVDVVESEIDRYLGWPGQAISYKVGEREWLAARADARRAAEASGRRFDLKAFHTAALDLGPLGLDLLRDEVARTST